MAIDIIRQTFDEWVRGSDALRARVVLFERVRDLPYAYPASRDPCTVLQQGRGSCSGKHYLLGEMFRLLDLQVRHMICTHRFNESPLPFPAPMQEMLRRNEIVDLHDYLQIRVKDGWIDIDATWERGLREFGFPVNEEWDGTSPMVVSVVPEDYAVAERDPERLKEELLSKLTPRQRALRKQFLEALSGWIDELTTEIQRDSGAA
ncbi:MAG TPA: transglutaminase domain-containing protein [Candidatus Margulisiibacteriota bacterium]|nr:transglutaminase domain-containing protein [Candidatus Margulisiibacteriota bacterium]